MLKGLKVMFVSCMAIGASAFAYQMINVQDIQASDYKHQTDVQTSSTKEAEELDNTPRINNTVSSSLQAIDEEKAKQIALDKIAGKFIKIVTEDDDYHVYIEKDGYKYDVEVDRYRGIVDDVEQEKVNSSQSMSEDKAKQLALAKVNGKIVNIESDDDDYTVYVEKDNYIYEIEINRYRGTIEDVDKENKPASNIAVISKEKAKEIALSKVNGTVIEIDYDNDDYQYDVTIHKDMIDFEIKIDAKSGGVLEVEKDD